MNTDLRVSLTAHFRGNFCPPLPVEYVDWAAELLPAMKEAEQEAADFGDFSLYEENVRVPDAVVQTGRIPKDAENRDDGPYVRLGDLVGAMHLRGYLDDRDK